MQVFRPARVSKRCYDASWLNLKTGGTGYELIRGFCLDFAIGDISLVRLNREPGLKGQRYFRNEMQKTILKRRKHNA